MYVVAKTKETGPPFPPHALDIASGMESSEVRDVTLGDRRVGTLMHSAQRKHAARPGFSSRKPRSIASGSNGCRRADTRGWVVAYDATTLLQMGSLNDTLNSKAARGNIWQSVSGLLRRKRKYLLFPPHTAAFDANWARAIRIHIVKAGWTQKRLGRN